MVKIVNVCSPIGSEQKQQFAVALCRVSTEDHFQKGLSIPEQRTPRALSHGLRHTFATHVLQAGLRLKQYRISWDIAE